jgi:hypothetical protein
MQFHVSHVIFQDNNTKGFYSSKDKIGIPDVGSTSWAVEIIYDIKAENEIDESKISEFILLHQVSSNK